MKAAMTVSWKCDRCGESGRRAHVVAVSKIQAIRDAYADHGVSIAQLESPDVRRHVEAMHITLRYAGAAGTQQPLFE